MADTDAALKINPKNQEAVERKQRLQKIHRKPPRSGKCDSGSGPAKKKP